MTAPRRPTAEGVALAVLAAAAALVLRPFQEVLPPDVAARLAAGALWILVWVVACLGAGWAALRAVGWPEGPGPALALATGAATLSATATVLSGLGLLSRWSLLVPLLAATIAGAWRLRRGGIGQGPWRGPGWLPWLLVLVPVAVQVAGITAAPVFYDTLNYHLAFPERWLAAGGWVEFPRHGYSYFPAACGSLYLYALAAVGGWGARAIHLVLGWTAALAAAELGSRLGGERAARWAAALFLLTPSVLQAGAFAAADLGVAAWGGAALVALTAPEGTARRRGIVAGLLVGTAVAAKYLAVLTVALPLVAAAAAGRWRWRAVPWMGVAAVAAVAPWLVRNLAWTGDPVFPFLAPLFGLPAQGLSVAGHVAQSAPGIPGWLPAWLVPLVALPLRTLRPLQVAGVLGPQWVLLAVPAALLVRHRRAWPLWAAAVTGLVAWGASVQFGRFLLPVLVPLGALTGTVMARLSARRDPAGMAVGALLAMVLAWNGSAALDRLGVERIRVVAGVEDDATFVSRWASYWPAVAAVDRLVPAAGRVLLVGEARAYGIPRAVLVEDPYRIPLLVELSSESRTAAELVARLRGLGVTHLLINRAEMARIARMRGLSDYFAEASPRARRRLEAAVGPLPVVWAGAGLELRAVTRR